MSSRAFRRTFLQKVVLLLLILIVVAAGSWVIYRQSSKALGDAGVSHHTIINGVDANNTNRSEAYYVGQVLTFRGYASGTATNDATTIPFTINLQPGSGNRVTMTSFDCPHCKGAGISGSVLPYTFDGKFTFKSGQTYTNELVYTITLRIDALASDQPVLSGFLDAPVAGGSPFYKGAIATYSRVVPAANRQPTAQANPPTPTRNNDPIDDLGDGSLSLPGEQYDGTIDDSYYAHAQGSGVTGNDLQGTGKQPVITPSPFFDGKQYAPGSSALATWSNDKGVVSNLAANWPLVGGFVALGGIMAGVAYWYWSKRA